MLAEAKLPRAVACGTQVHHCDTVWFKPTTWTLYILHLHSFFGVLTATPGEPHSILCIPIPPGLLLWQTGRLSRLSVIWDASPFDLLAGGRVSALAWVPRQPHFNIALRGQQIESPSTQSTCPCPQGMFLSSATCLYSISTQSTCPCPQIAELNRLWAQPQPELLKSSKSQLQASVTHHRLIGINYNLVYGYNSLPSSYLPTFSSIGSADRSQSRGELASPSPNHPTSIVHHTMRTHRIPSKLCTRGFLRPSYPNHFQRLGNSNSLTPWHPDLPIITSPQPPIRLTSNFVHGDVLLSKPHISISKSPALLDRPPRR